MCTLRAHLSLLIKFQTHIEELLQNVFNGSVLGNSSLSVKRDEVRGCNRSGQLELVLEALFKCGSQMLLFHLNFEVNIFVGVVILVVFDERRDLLCLYDFFEFVLEILCPSTNWQLGNPDFCLAYLVDDTAEFEAVCPRGSDLAFEAAEPWLHWNELLTVHHALEI